MFKAPTGYDLTAPPSVAPEPAASPWSPPSGYDLTAPAINDALKVEDDPLVKGILQEVAPKPDLTDFVSSARREAKALGMNPEHYLTGLLYESPELEQGNYWQAGPRTKWGQHRGAFQWGEPQAQQYGVHGAMPISDQLAAGSRYLLDRGFQPGMGLEDFYSTINAGAPGRYGASDRPGETVSSHVQRMLNERLPRAQALLASYPEQMDMAADGPSFPVPSGFDRGPPFDPEGDGYDYDTAKEAGLKPDETGHWPSLDPRTGMVLKGKKHKTWGLTEDEEGKLGNEISQGDDGRYYSSKGGRTWGEGLAYGADVVQKAGYDFAQWAGQVSGYKELEDWGKSGSDAEGRELKNQKGMSDPFEIDSFSKAGQFLKDVISEQVPIMAGPLAGSMAGGAIGAGVGSIVPGIGTAIGGTVGAMVGAFVPSFVLSTGMVQGSVEELGVEVAPGWVAVGGTAVAMLDTYIPGKLGSTLVKKLGGEAAEKVAQRILMEPAEGFLKRTAIEAGKGMVGEAGTEGAQEIIEAYAAAQGAGAPMDWSGAMYQAGQAALAGGVMGAGFGAATGAAQKPAPQQNVAENVTQDLSPEGLQDKIDAFIPPPGYDLLAPETKGAESVSPGSAPDSAPAPTIASGAQPQPIIPDDLGKSKIDPSVTVRQPKPEPMPSEAPEPPDDDLQSRIKAADQLPQAKIDALGDQGKVDPGLLGRTPDDDATKWRLPEGYEYDKPDVSRETYEADFKGQMPRFGDGPVKLKILSEGLGFLNVEDRQGRQARVPRAMWEEATAPFRAKQMKELEALLQKPGVTADELYAHPALARQRRSNALQRPTDARDTYLSPEWRAYRELQFGQEQVKGYRQGLDRWEKQARSFTPAVKAERKAMIVTGNPGAGKSTVVEGKIAPARGMAVIDPDMIKENIPEFQGGQGSSAVHEESMWLMAKLADRFIERGENIIFPKSGLSAKGIKLLIDRLKGAGYSVDLVNVDVSRDVAAKRQIKRWLTKGRFIDPDYANAVAENALPNYRKLRDEKAADRYANIDANEDFVYRVTEDGEAVSDIEGLAGRGGSRPGSRVGQGQKEAKPRQKVAAAGIKSVEKVPPPRTVGAQYHARQDALAKFKKLKAEWATLNNELLHYVDDYNNPKARELAVKLKRIVRQIDALDIDTGGPEGVGLPGGPRDVVIIGAGPGGMAAAIAGGAEGLDTLLIGGGKKAGGQAKFSSRIENFPGFPIGVTGKRLTSAMFDQVERMTPTMIGPRAVKLDHDPKTGLKTVTLDNGKKITARTVILAGGASFRRIKGLEGEGVVYGDGEELAQLAKDDEAVVIGGSNGAAQAALGAAKSAKHVYVLSRSPITESMSDYQVHALRNNPKITVVEGDQVAKINRLQSGEIESVTTKAGKELPCCAIGVFAGSAPHTKWLPQELQAEGGGVKAGAEGETAIPGVFAIGDFKAGGMGRIGAAVGDGQEAIKKVFRSLEDQQIAAQEAKKAKPLAAGIKTKQTDTPAFKAWFGNSKVVDAKGKPLVVYHGTDKDFDAFDLGVRGSRTNAGTANLGFFFSDNPLVANRFARGAGGRSMPVYLALKNPLEIGELSADDRKRTSRDAYDAVREAIVKKTGKASWNEVKIDDIEAWRQIVIDAGFDGLVFRQTAMDAAPRSIAEPYSDHFVAFFPEQIKSAIGNRGTFDPSKPSILAAGIKTKPEAKKEERWITHKQPEGEGKGFWKGGRRYAPMPDIASDVKGFVKGGKRYAPLAAGIKSTESFNWKPAKEFPAQWPDDYYMAQAASGDHLLVYRPSTTTNYMGGFYKGGYDFSGGTSAVDNNIKNWVLLFGSVTAPDKTKPTDLAEAKALLAALYAGDKAKPKVTGKAPKGDVGDWTELNEAEKKARGFGDEVSVWLKGKQYIGKMEHWDQFSHGKIVEGKAQHIGYENSFGEAALASDKLRSKPKPQNITDLIPKVKKLASEIFVKNGGLDGVAAYEAGFQVEWGDSVGKAIEAVGGESYDTIIKHIAKQYEGWHKAHQTALASAIFDLTTADQPTPSKFGLNQIVDDWIKKVENDYEAFHPKEADEEAHGIAALRNWVKDVLIPSGGKDTFVEDGFGWLQGETADALIASIQKHLNEQPPAQSVFITPEKMTSVSQATGIPKHALQKAVEAHYNDSKDIVQFLKDEGWAVEEPQGVKAVQSLTGEGGVETDSMSEEEFQTYASPEEHPKYQEVYDEIYSELMENAESQARNDYGPQLGEGTIDDPDPYYLEQNAKDRIDGDPELVETAFKEVLADNDIEPVGGQTHTQPDLLKEGYKDTTVTTKPKHYVRTQDNAEEGYKKGDEVPAEEIAELREEAEEKALEDATKQEEKWYYEDEESPRTYKVTGDHPKTETEWVNDSGSGGDWHWNGNYYSDEESALDAIWQKWWEDEIGESVQADLAVEAADQAKAKIKEIILEEGGKIAPAKKPAAEPKGNLHLLALTIAEEFKLNEAQGKVLFSVMEKAQAKFNDPNSSQYLGQNENWKKGFMKGLEAHGALAVLTPAQKEKAVHDTFLWLQKNKPPAPPKPKFHDHYATSAYERFKSDAAIQKEKVAGGLDMDFEAREARRKKLGFVTKAYKGVRQKDDYVVLRSPQSNLEDRGAFFSDDPKIANEFSGGTMVYPVWLRTAGWKVIDYKGASYSSHGGNDNQISKAKQEGYTGLWLKNVKDSGGTGDQLIAWNTSDIRSWHARFDESDQFLGDILAAGVHSVKSEYRQQDFAKLRQLAQKMKQATAIVHRIAGPIEIVWHETISSSMFNFEYGTESTVGGYYMPAQHIGVPADALIGLAHSDPDYDALTIAGHEAFHHVEHALANKEEIRWITDPREMQRVRDFAAEEIGEMAYSIPDIEARAFAFQRYRRLRDAGGYMEGRKINPAILRLWERMRQFLRRIKDVLIGEGIKRFEDIFERAASGAMAGRQPYNRGIASAEALGAAQILPPRKVWDAFLELAPSPEERKLVEDIVERLPDSVKLTLAPDKEQGATSGWWNPTKSILALVFHDMMDPVSTLLHEEVHALRSLGLFTDEEWAILVEHAKPFRTRKGEFADGTATSVEQAYRASYGNRNYPPEYLEEVIDEEAVGFMLGDYRREVGLDKEIDPILHKGTQFLDALAKATHDAGIDTVDDIIARIESGEVGKRPVKRRQLWTREGKFVDHPGVAAAGISDLWRRTNKSSENYKISGRDIYRRKVWEGALPPSDPAYWWSAGYLAFQEGKPRKVPSDHQVLDDRGASKHAKANQWWKLGWEQARMAAHFEKGAHDIPGVDPDTIAGDILAGKRPVLLAGIKSVGPDGIVQPPPKAPPEQWAGNINLNKIEDAKDVPALLKELAEHYEGFMDARGGRISHARTRELAALVGMDPSKLAKKRKNMPGLREAEMFAARSAMVAGGQRLYDLAEKAKGGSDADKVALLKERARLGAIAEYVAGETAYAGRLLNQFKMVAGGDKELMAALLNDQGQNVDAFIDMVTGLKDPKKIAAFSNKSLATKTFDVLMEIWINSLLSGPVTHAANFAGNALTAVWQVPEAMVSSVISKFTGSGIPMGAAAQRAFGLVQGMSDGAKAAIQAIKTEEPTGFAGKIEAAHQKAIPGKLGRVVRTPGTALLAADEFYKAINYRAEINYRAMLQAKSEGLTGDAYNRRLADLVANPTERMMRYGRAAAERQTYTNQAGPIAKAIQGLVAKAPLLRFIVPFIRTPANIVTFVARRTPFGLLFKDVQADLKGVNGAQARDEAIARMALGSAVSLMAVYMAAQGFLTGGGPDDPKERSLLYATGWQPYSILIGGTYYSYARFEPLAMLLGIATDAYELQKKMTEDEKANAAALLIGAVSRNLTNKTFLRGIAEMIEVWQDPERYGYEWWKNFSGTLVPTGVAQWARTRDPYLREARTVLDNIKSRIPGLRETLTKRRDILGEEIKKEGAIGPDIISPVYQNALKNNPAAQEMLRVGYAPGMPGRSINSVQLTPDQYEAYAIYAGRGTKEAVEKLIANAGYQRMSEDRQKYFIKRAVDDARERARKMVVRDFADLRQAIKEKRAAAAGRSGALVEE